MDIADSGWVVLFASAITGLSTLTAVALTQRLDRARAQDERLWIERSRAYVELVTWTTTWAEWLGHLERDTPEAPPADLRARITAFGSSALQRYYADLEIAIALAQADNHPRDPRIQLAVDGALVAVSAVVRRDLTGDDRTWKRRLLAAAPLSAKRKKWMEDRQHIRHVRRAGIRPRR